MWTIITIWKKVFELQKSISVSRLNQCIHGISYDYIMLNYSLPTSNERLWPEIQIQNNKTQENIWSNWVEYVIFAYLRGNNSLYYIRSKYTESHQTPHRYCIQKQLPASWCSPWGNSYIWYRSSHRMWILHHK